MLTNKKSYSLTTSDVLLYSIQAKALSSVCNSKSPVTEYDGDTHDLVFLFWPLGLPGNKTTKST